MYVVCLWSRWWVWKCSTRQSNCLFVCSAAIFSIITLKCVQSMQPQNNHQAGFGKSQSVIQNGSIIEGILLTVWGNNITYLVAVTYYEVLQTTKVLFLCKIFAERFRNGHQITVILCLQWLYEFCDFWAMIISQTTKKTITS